MTSDSLWFTNARVDIRLSNRENADRVSVTEHAMAYGFSPPQHVHHTESETFYVLEGTFRFVMDDKVSIAGPGDLIHIPAGAKHCFVVLSPDGGRCLTITSGGFEDLVREVSRPAANDGLPEQAAPTLAEQRALAEACVRNGIELLGPPLAA